MHAQKNAYFILSNDVYLFYLKHLMCRKKKKKKEVNSIETISLANSLRLIIFVCCSLCLYFLFKKNEITYFCFISRNRSILLVKRQKIFRNKISAAVFTPNKS